jgi:LacI family transcriptional regulator
MAIKVTMKDIADKLGISVNAVSLALNNRKGVSEETRSMVLKSAVSLGYLDKKPRYSGAFGQHHICVLLQDIYPKDIDFYGAIFYYLAQEARTLGYDTLFHQFNDEKLIVPDCISAERVAGIIVLGKISDSNVEKLKFFAIPLVIVDHAPRRLNINCILTDNISGGFMAANFLIASGFRKIGFFGDLSYTISVKERYYGFLEALDQAGIVSINQASGFIKKYSIVSKIEQYLIDTNTAAIKKLLPPAKYLPEAYCCSNDKAALTLISALREKGVNVPADVSVIGFDNFAFAEKISPRLTTINVNRELMGRKAVRRLVYLIENRDDQAEHIHLGVSLVERESVKCL